MTTGTTSNRSSVKVEIYDVNGRLIESVADRTYPAGRHVATWSGRTPHGDAPSGVYFLKFRSEGHSSTQRIVVIR